jgi:hypothetical protein
MVFALKDIARLGGSNDVGIVDKSLAKGLYVGCRSIEPEVLCNIE